MRIVFSLPHAAANHVLTEPGWKDLHVRHEGATIAAVLAPGMDPFIVGKPARFLDISHVWVSSGHINERVLNETAGQQAMTLAGVL